MRTIVLLLLVAMPAAACSSPADETLEAPARTGTVVTTTTPATLPTTTTRPAESAAIEADTADPVPSGPPAGIDTIEPRLEDDVAALLGFGPRPSGSDAELAAFDWIERRLGAMGVAVTVEEVPLPTGATSRNLIARFGGDGPSVLLGAHVDSIETSPGIDDNGSGVVILLEIARLLLADPPGASVSLVFFGAEEILPGFGRNDHHYGSRLHAASLAERGELPAAMVSVDMVGVGEDLLAVTYRDTDPTTAEELQAAAAKLGVEVELQSRGDISDHEGFARLGVPAAMLWRPDNPAYHSPDDTSVRPEALGEVIEIVLSWLRG